MLDIKISGLIARGEFVKYLSIAWNGDIEIYLSDPTKGKHQEDFDHWKYWCVKNHDKTIEDVTIGNHAFDEDFFHVKTDVSDLIKNQNEGNIQIVLIPKRSKAIQIEIEDMIIPKEFVRIIKFRNNRMEIRLEQPDNETESFNKFVESMALSGFHEGKVVNNVKLGKGRIFEGKTFRFSSKPDLKMPGVKPSTNVIFLSDNSV